MSGKRHRPSQDRKCITDPIPRAFPGHTAVLIAGGWSLTTAQVNTAKKAWVEGRCKVFGVNNAYEIAPWIDGLYAADDRFWDLHIEAIRDTNIPLLFSQSIESSKKYGLWNTPGKGRSPHGPGISTDPSYIRFGFNSGFQMFNIAVLMGFTKICLIGYDYCYEPETGKKHWFGDHEHQELNRVADLRSWATCYRSTVDQLAGLGVEVVQCSTPISPLDSFRFSTLGKEL